MILEKFTEQIEFKSYEDFKTNFKVKIPKRTHIRRSG